MLWTNQFSTCNCTGSCGHAGFHSYEGVYPLVLRIVRPSLVFEWGPGPNSRMAVEAGARVCAVESKAQFVPQGLPAHKFSCRIAPVQSAEYVNIGPYAHADLFFIDGRRRSDCIRSVRSCCLDRAVLCLHDAQRERYHEALRSFEYVKFLARGFAVASRTCFVLDRFPVHQPKVVEKASAK